MKKFWGGPLRATSAEPMSCTTSKASLPRSPHTAPLIKLGVNWQSFSQPWPIRRSSQHRPRRPRPRPLRTNSHGHSGISPYKGSTTAVACPRPKFLPPVPKLVLDSICALLTRPAFRVDGQHSRRARHVNPPQLIRDDASAHPHPARRAHPIRCARCRPKSHSQRVLLSHEVRRQLRHLHRSNG